jgi:hypothetical protein
MDPRPSFIMLRIVRGKKRIMKGHDPRIGKYGLVLEINKVIIDIGQDLFYS